MERDWVTLNLGSPRTLIFQVEPAYFDNRVLSGSFGYWLPARCRDTGVHPTEECSFACVGSVSVNSLLENQTADIHDKSGLLLHLASDALELALPIFPTTAGEEPVGATTLVLKVFDQ